MNAYEYELLRQQEEYGGCPQGYPPMNYYQIKEMVNSPYSPIYEGCNNILSLEGRNLPDGPISQYMNMSEAEFNRLYPKQNQPQTQQSVVGQMQMNAPQGYGGYGYNQPQYQQQPYQQPYYPQQQQPYYPQQQYPNNQQAVDPNAHNPYVQMGYSQGYGQPMMNQPGYPQPYQYQQPYYPQQQYPCNNQQQFTQMNAPVNPYQPVQGMGGYNYGYNNYNSQYQYEQYIQSQMYDMDSPSGFDPFDCLRDVILSDEERKMANRNNGYYNQQNYYAEQQRRMYQQQQELLKQERVLSIRLSKAAHCGTGDDITEEEIIEYYIPTPPEPTPIRSMTREEIEHANELAHVDQTAILHQQLMMQDSYMADFEQRLAVGYAKIKESHDKILGLKKGQNSITDYLNNAGNLYIDALKAKQRRMYRDGSLKYARSGYKRSFLPDSVKNDPNTPISAFIDDDFVPLEKRIREQYLLKKMNNHSQYMRLEADGSYTPMVPPPPVSPEVEQERAEFLDQATRGMKKW